MATSDAVLSDRRAKSRAIITFRQYVTIGEEMFEDRVFWGLM
jgi:hypothetical protein